MPNWRACALRRSHKPYNAPWVGAYTAFSSNCRISSTRVFVAASTSSRSTKRPESISVQAEQVPHGVAVTPISQFSDLARIRAMVVLPTPRVPVKREPGGDLLSHTVSALSSARLRFTVLFEMGRGGSKVLWPPSITCSFVAGAANAKLEEGGCDCVIELR